MFSAVPPMVWSAFRLMAANASSSEKRMPAAPATRIAMRRPIWLLPTVSPQPAVFMARSTRQPQRAPMIMMPSMAMLMMPERSEYIAPNATSSSGMANEIVWLRILANATSDIYATSFFFPLKTDESLMRSRRLNAAR